MMRGYLERVVLGEERGAASWLIRALLWPLSLVYRLGLWVYLGIYGTGLRKRHQLNVPVVSVGNLTFGGTGKTPVVQAICRMLIARGKRVAILSRGHGGSARGSVIVSDGESVLSSTAQCGDEPVMLAESLPGVPVISGKDRRQSGALALERFRPDVIVLDDGLQYWQLHRDLDVVVTDAGKPFGSGFVMPMGDLREPASGLRRADVILLSGAEALPEAEKSRLMKRLTGLAPRAMVLSCARRASRLRRVEDAGAVAMSWLVGRKVLAFCGIGKPQSFVGLIESLDGCVESVLLFPDHHPYKEKDLALIESERESSGAEAIITTEKDAVRLPKNAPIRGLYVLGIEIEIDGQERLGEYLADRIDRPREAVAGT